ncbi:unnamed protein product [Rotaria magnacalcarata]
MDRAPEYLHNITTATSPSPSKKRPLSSTNTASIKHKKKESVIDSNGEHESPNEKVINDLVKSTFASNNEASIEDPASTKKKLVWNDKWLEFKEAQTLEEIKIDTQSTVKWCPDFISKEEGDALFDHLMEELNFEHTEISMYGKPVNLVTSSSIVVRRRGLSRKGVISEAETTCLDFTNAETENST